MTGIGKPGNTLRHDQTRCETCRFWSPSNQWCSYGDIMKQSRLANGGELLPSGGCRLYEKADPEQNAQDAMRRKWGAGETDGEAYARARAQERAQERESERRARIQPKLPASVFRRMEELYRQGLSDAAIAATVGCGDTTVQRWRKRNGMESNFVKRMRESKGEG